MVSQSEGEQPKRKRITRRMDVGPNRRSVITDGTTEVTIIQVSNRGHKGFQVEAPEGWRIEHRKGEPKS